ncbi:MAG: hypothetical protein V1896_02410 [Candidatus Zambryskibacteria bacterium]
MKKGDKKEFSKEELARHVGALSERYHDDIKTIKEGVKSLLQSSARQEKTLESHSGQIARLTTDVTVVKTNTKELETNVKELRVDMLEVKSKLTKLNLDVKFDLERKIDKNLFVDLEGRVRVLEKK